MKTYPLQGGQQCLYEAMLMPTSLAGPTQHWALTQEKVGSSSHRAENREQCHVRFPVETSVD